MPIEEKLQLCRVELQSKGLKKSGENKFAKFKYFELGDFIPTVNEMFAEHRMFSNFSIDDAIAKLTIVDVEDKSQQVFTSPVADADVKGCTAIQSLGAVHTYLKRYLYLNALEIVENDALDASVGSKEFEPVKDDTKIYIQLAKLEDLAEIKDFYNKYKEQVKDRKRLYTMVQEKAKAIKALQEQFEVA